MHIDLNEKLGTMLKWDFSLGLDGQSFPTKPISVADLGALHKAVNGGKLDELMKLLPTLFVGDEAAIKKWIEGMRAEMLLSAASLIAEYFREVTGKNCKALTPMLAELVRATAAATMKNSESSSSIQS